MLAWLPAILGGLYACNSGSSFGGSGNYSVGFHADEWALGAWALTAILLIAIKRRERARRRGTTESNRYPRWLYLLALAPLAVAIPRELMREKPASRFYWMTVPGPGHYEFPLTAGVYDFYAISETLEAARLGAKTARDDATCTVEGHGESLRPIASAAEESGHHLWASDSKPDVYGVRFLAFEIPKPGKYDVGCTLSGEGRFTLGIDARGAPRSFVALAGALITSIIFLFVIWRLRKRPVPTVERGGVPALADS